MSKSLQKAIDKLADCFEFGHLKADTTPADFIEEAADEVCRLREENERLNNENTKLAQDWHRHLGVMKNAYDELHHLREENASLNAVITKKFRELPNMKGWLEAGGDALLAENTRLTQEVKCLELRIDDFEKNWILKEKE